MQGRTVAKTYEEAVRMATEKIRAKGYESVNLRLYPCPVQPYPDRVWWEWVCEIQYRAFLAN
jgi:hypothetical protein